MAYEAAIAASTARRAVRSVLDLVPRRALLYVPGDSERKIAKVAQLIPGPDVVCLDCEDAVAANRKEEARATVAAALRDTAGTWRSERAVRVNSVQSGHCEEDLRAVLGSGVVPDALVVPKARQRERGSSQHHAMWLLDRAASILGGRAQQAAPPALITMCESGLALLNLRAVIETLLDRPHVLRLEACIFGADDFMHSLGVRRQPGASDLTLPARQTVALTCRAFGVQPIDQVWIDYKDAEGLQAEAEEGRRLGFAGKQVIHPSQVGPVQRYFSVDAEEAAAARELVAAYNHHQERGVGAFEHRGKMIDSPTYLQARLQAACSLIKLAEREATSGETS
eukprot:scaffold6.g2681.t1